MRKNKNILKKGMILAAVSTMVVTMAPAIPAYAYGEADLKTGQAALMRQQQVRQIIRAG